MRRLLPYFSLLSLPLFIYLVIYAKYIVPTTYAQVAGSNYIYPSASVGVGTTTPNLQLDVSNPSSNGDGIAIGQQYDNTESIQTYIDSKISGGGWATRKTYANGCCNNLLLEPDVGNVGIGTTTPQAKLHVNGGGLFNGYVSVNEGWNPAQQISINSNQIWKSNSSSADQTLYLQFSTPGGNVMIGGQSGASNSLYIPNGNLIQGGGIFQLNNGDMGGGSRIQFLNFNNTANGPAIYGANNGILYIQGSPAYSGQGASDQVIFRNHDGGTNEVTVDTSNGNISTNGTVVDHKPWFIAGDNRGWVDLNGWQTIAWNTVLAGNSGGWYSTSNGRFTAPTSGLYFCSSELYSYPAGSSANYYIHDLISCNGAWAGGCGTGDNGSYTIYSGYPYGGDYYSTPQTHRFLKLNAGDYVQNNAYAYGDAPYGFYGQYSQFACSMISG